MKFIQEWLQKNGKKVAYLKPSIVQMIQHEDTSEEDDNEVSVKNLIRDLDLENSKYIFLPVNDSVELCKDAGDHQSLLVYEKKTNKFYHYDSMGSSNKKHARKIITFLTKANKCFKDEMEEKEKHTRN